MVRFEFPPVGLFYFRGKKYNFMATVKRSAMLIVLRVEG
jgi:hypothetical protein